MRTQSIDTNQKTEDVLISLIRKAKPSKKFDQVRSLSQTALNLSRRAINRKNSALDDVQQDILFVNYYYGPELSAKFCNYIQKKINEKS
ncbi:MAG TPA: hypothetical protein ENO27_02390 [Caldithrix sp.]|nr:hypothetical protein [Caldithrix sp.]